MTNQTLIMKALIVVLSKDYISDNALAKTKALVDAMTYEAYRHNRRLHPEHPPTYWAGTFADIDKLEERYQDDLFAERAKYDYHS